METLPMKTLLKFAVGAAIAGALVKLLIRQLSGNGMSPSRGERFTAAALSTAADMVGNSGGH
jgi:hypothetical protein